MRRLLSILFAMGLALIVSLMPKAALACGCVFPCAVNLATGCCECPTPTCLTAPPYNCSFYPPTTPCPQITFTARPQCNCPLPAAECSIRPGLTVVEKTPLGYVDVPVSISITSVAAPPFTDPPSATYHYEIIATAGRWDGFFADTTVGMALAGTGPTSCAAAGSVGACTVTFAPGSELTSLTGSVVLDPPGQSFPAHPSVFNATAILRMDCGPCDEGGLLLLGLRVLGETIVPGSLLEVCSTPPNCEVQILPCDSFSTGQVPTLSTPTPIVCAESSEHLDVRMSVRRNGYPNPLRAHVTASSRPAGDPIDLFTGFPVDIPLDFAGMTSEVQDFTVGCGIHGPCFAGVGNRLHVELFDAVTNTPIVSNGGSDIVEVLVCSTPFVRKRLVSQDGANFHWQLLVRNPSLEADLERVEITDTFPGQTITSVTGEIEDFPMDDSLGFVTPVALRQPSGRISFSRDRLRISGLTLGRRDGTNVRVLHDVVHYDVRTVAGAGLCGETVLNAGATLSGSYAVTTGGVTRLQPVTGSAPAMRFLCTCPLSHGYWKTHNRFAQQPSLAKPWPIDEMTMLCGRTWIEVITMPSRPGDENIILGRQWVAAKLNVANGAPEPPAVAAAIAEADALLHACPIPAASRNRALALAAMLDAYNNDTQSPGNCVALP